jgi:hypothetical protein
VSHGFLGFSGEFMRSVDGSGVIITAKRPSEGENRDAIAADGPRQTRSELDRSHQQSTACGPEIEAEPPRQLVTFELDHKPNSQIPFSLPTRDILLND